MSTTTANRFTEKVIIITGGAAGLGLATAVRLGSEGARLTLVDIDSGALDQARATLTTDADMADEDILTIAADVSSEEDVRGYVEATMDKWGRIDGFFNNAGINGAQKPIEDYEPAELEKVLKINTLGVYLGLHAVLPIMHEQGSGRVVNTASIGGIRGWARHYGYISSKHAVVGLTKGAAVESGEYGVTVNAVAPGGVRTAMAVEAMKKVNPEDPAAAEAEFCSGVPLRRMATPEEIAGTVAFLLSDDAGFINGHVLVADGGQTAKS